MAATGTPTPNIGLRRPQGTDPASVDDINYNSNLLDTKLGAVGNTSVQEQINSLNSKISTYLNAYDSRVKNAAPSDNAKVTKRGNVVSLTGYIEYLITPTSAQTSVLVLPQAYCPNENEYFTCIRESDGVMFVLQASNAGNINIFNRGAIRTGDRFYIGMSYVV